MKGQDFCRIFLFSLLNLICFLLSIVFLCSSYNIKHHSVFICDKEISSKYNKQYKGICTLFSFNLISFLIFIVGLIILIKKDKMDIGNDQSNTNNDDDQNDNNSIYNQNNNNNNNDIMNDKIIGYDNTTQRFRKGNNSQKNRNNQNENNDIISQNKTLVNILFITFLLCQFFYFLEIIVLSSFYGRSNIMETQSKDPKT